MWPAGKTLALYALTRTGAQAASRLVRDMPGAALYLPVRLKEDFPEAEFFEQLAPALTANFRNYDGHILFCATGIVVRTLAPLLKSKTRDPAVVVADQEGRFAISLLSGHLGGANALARTVAGILNGRAVITTATDTQGLPSLEMAAAELGYGVENIKALAGISADLLEGRQVEVYDPGEWLRPVLEKWPGLFRLLKEDPPPGTRLVWVGWQAVEPIPDRLVIRPPCLALGLGCNRGTPVEEVEELWQEVFEGEGLSPACLKVLASVAAKRDEPGLLEFGRRLGLPIRFYEADELKQIKVPNPSAMVMRHMGVGSVCEAAAILATDKGRLVVQKRKSGNVTLAVALASFSSSD